MMFRFSCFNFVSHLAQNGKAKNSVSCSLIKCNISKSYASSSMEKQKAEAVGWKLTMGYSCLKLTSDTMQNSFPYVFLRDNCQCPKCFHPSTKQRLLNTAFEVDVDIKPVEARSEDGVVHLTWPDGHVSSFSHEWMLKRKFPKTDQDIKSKSKCNLEPELWDSKHQNEIRTFEFEDVVKDAETRLSWLESIATAGLVLIRHAPPKLGVLENDVINMLGGFVKGTHYGDFHQVQQRNDPNNLAYTSNNLPLHVDLPYYGYQPGLLLLHCIENASGKGGDSTYVDGFNVATKMKENDPEAFDILSSVKFKFVDVGADLYGEFHTEFERPIIGLDMFGNIERIGVSNESRSSLINAPAEKVQKAYEAYVTLVREMYKPENLISYKLKPGDIMTLDNRRVLHGRAAFNASSFRLLETCFFDWDEVYSCIRVLRKRLGIETFE